MRNYNLTFRLLALALLCSLSMSAANSQQYSFNFVAAYKQAQEKRIEADKKLLSKMEDLADWLNDFKDQNGHYPEPGTEQDRTSSVTQAKMLLPCPYSQTGAPSAAELKKPCSLRFATDSSLNMARIREWQKHPPSDWHADPGTITVISSDKTLAIWGAGADRQPIYDSKNNRYFIAWRNQE